MLLFSVLIAIDTIPLAIDTIPLLNWVCVYFFPIRRHCEDKFFWFVTALSHNARV